MLLTSSFYLFQFIELRRKKNVNKSSFNNQIDLRLKWEATLNCVRPARSSISIDAVREQRIYIEGFAMLPRYDEPFIELIEVHAGLDILALSLHYGGSDDESGNIV